MGFTIHKDLKDFYSRDAGKDIKGVVDFVEEKCGNKIDDLTLSGIIDKRIRTKSLCFEYINPDIYLLLECLKAKIDI